MKKILMVLDELFPVRGAPQVRIQNLLASLPEWEGGAFGGSSDKAEPPSGYVLIDRPSESKPLAFVSFLLRLGVCAVRFAKKLRPDVIVLSVPKYEMLFFASALSKLSRVFVLDFRDSLAFLDYGAYLSHFLPKGIATRLGSIILRVNRVLQRRAIRSASLVTVANEGIKRSISHPRVVVVPNGVDTELFVPKMKRWFDGTRPLRLVYLGNFAEKDLFEWVAAFKGSLKVEIHLIGDGRNRARVLGQLEGISTVYHGLLSHDELPSVLEQMDIGFIFRKSGVDESIPVCLFEYTSMNIPCVCNETGIMAGFVREHGMGYVVRDEEAFVSTVGRILDHPGELRCFEKLHEVAEQEFSLRASREKFRQAVDSAMPRLGNSSNPHV
jgi:glycosyltransferase involved in cell wall biosynthesis